MHKLKLPPVGELQDFLFHRQAAGTQPNATVAFPDKMAHLALPADWHKLIQISVATRHHRQCLVQLRAAAAWMPNADTYEARG